MFSLYTSLETLFRFLTLASIIILKIFSSISTKCLAVSSSICFSGIYSFHTVLRVSYIAILILLK
ncbi:MAG: hypothetical protein LM582_03705 [Desulfurococcaceae archaeon]|nr:hypothetical protein [Desulfurococcaceae archaeon]